MSEAESKKTEEQDHAMRVARFLGFLRVNGTIGLREWLQLHPLDAKALTDAAALFHAERAALVADLVAARVAAEAAASAPPSLEGDRLENAARRALAAAEGRA